MANCPTGKYEDTVGYTCPDCLASCGSCSDGTTCDTCSIGGAWPIFYGNLCIGVNDCPSHYYGDLGTGLCEACDSNCDECSSTATTCISCDPLGPYPFLY